jgi:uncharacterized protein
VDKSCKLSRDQDAAILVRVDHLFLLALAILLLTAHPLCAAQSRGYDKQLFQAVAKGDIGAVRVLLANGADIEAQDDRGTTPLISAVEGHSIEIVKLLLEKGANISAQDRYEGTALMEAAGSWDPRMLRILLDASPDIKDKTAALLSAVEGGPVVLQMQDAPITADEHHQQAAAAASEPPWVSNVRMLLDSGVNVEARDEEGETPLMRAASYGQTEIFELLLARGARINVRDNRGTTPLIAAACACALATMNDTYDIIKALLEKGANVNARTRDGTTALMMAAGSPDDAASVKLLLSKGADPMAKDNQGKTAITFAKDSPFPEKVRLLKRAMAKAH